MPLKSTVNFVSLRTSQFELLQQQLQKNDCIKALETAETLINQPLANVQRALVLKLQGDASRGAGDMDTAWCLWLESLMLRFSPQLAFVMLESITLPAFKESTQKEWFMIFCMLVDQGYEVLLLRFLSTWIEQWPLQQQRQQFFELVNQNISYIVDRDGSFNLLLLRLQQISGVH